MEKKIKKICGWCDCLLEDGETINGLCSHGLCPECEEKYFSDEAIEREMGKDEKPLPTANSIMGIGLVLGLAAGLLAGCYEEKCTMQAHNFCVDESLYEADDMGNLVDILHATLACAGIDELSEMTYVRIIDDQMPLRESACRYKVAGCSWGSFGEYEIEIDTTGAALAHELGHVIEDYYGVSEYGVFGSIPKLPPHRPCGLAVMCADGVPDETCDWRTE